MHTKRAGTTLHLKARAGFTIVELLIVIVVIAILAAITIVSYNGVTSRAKDSATQTGAKEAFSKIATFAIDHGDAYPATLAETGLPTDGATNYQYTVNNVASPRTFCLTASVSGLSYYVSNANSTPTKGACPGHIEGGDNTPVTVKDMQLVTTATCPSTRTLVKDGRDDRTYWIQKLADGKCWMLTNLAYAGGGMSFYGDRRTISEGTTVSDAVPYYYVPAAANVTASPAEPSASTNGGVTNPQYGYLYNFCAANAAQSGNGACSNISLGAVNTSLSICPSGWRLPSGGVAPGGEFGALNTAVNSGIMNRDDGLRSVWLSQYGGYQFSGGHSGAGATARYWSNTVSPTSAASAGYMNVTATSIVFANQSKNLGMAVRCLASY